MNEDDVMSDNPPSWLKRLGQALGKTPKTQEQLVEFLRDAQNLGVLSPDSLRMIEGVLQISQMCVGEIMLPRSEMVVIHKDATYEEILPIAIKSGHSRF